MEPDTNQYNCIRIVNERVKFQLRKISVHQNQFIAVNILLQFYQQFHAEESEKVISIIGVTGSVLP